MAWEQQQLRRQATQWVHQACEAPRSAQQQSHLTVLTASYAGPPDAHGVRAVVSIDTGSVSSSFFPAAYQQGVVLYEPCGGLCAGLEMLLRNDICVQQYLYSDTDPTTQRVALHRVRSLQSQYPNLLQQEALAASFVTLPTDIKLVTAQQLISAILHAPVQQWMVVAG